MTTEMTMLTFAIALGLVQLILATQAATKQRGLKWNLSPRDQKMPDLTGTAGRLDRAFKNFMETFPFFMGAVLLLTLMKVSTRVSGLGSEMYLIARIIYIPVYVTGTPVLRTIIWVIGIIGILMMLSALF